MKSLGVLLMLTLLSVVFGNLSINSAGAAPFDKRSVSCRLVVNDVFAGVARTNLDELPQDKNEGLGQVAVLTFTNSTGSKLVANITRADLFSKPTSAMNEVIMHVTHNGRTYSSYGIFETRLFITDDSKKTELDEGQEVYAACSVYPRDEIK